ncbi:MAG: hypothetical protein NC452_08520 [Eubacterium sp.]|nr:hypothetical protein [Eubacterium sp.]
MSKIVSSAKIAEKFDHFAGVHFETSICVNMDSFERSIYVLGRRARIDNWLCTAVTENGDVVPLDLDNLVIAAKMNYSKDFVGYVKINEACEKISTKSPYNYNFLFMFAFVCEDVALKILLTKPAATNAGLSGMDIDVGIKDDNTNSYNKVMEGISAVTSILKSTALRNVENSGAFAGFFEPSHALPETVQVTSDEEDGEYYV